MKWLKTYTDIPCDTATFIEAMSMSGSNVEGVEVLGEGIQGVVVGRILKIESHPDADKLVVTQVDIGKEVIQVVTGATNISEDDLVPVALPGASLADGLKIKKGKLRGIASNGMMCSVEELGLELSAFPEAPENGIYIFNETYPLGEDVKPLFGLDDEVVEFEITSNRPDCFSILGLAREAAATFNTAFHYPETDYKTVSGNIEEAIQVKVEAQDLCPRFVAKVIKDVVIETSPKWLQDQLRSVGIKPINNLVDITNFVMLEMGQPMHAYDLSTLADRKIIVRRANEGETMTTLDGETHKLDSSMLMIADGKEAIGLAGIMGGDGSKVQADTQIILLEAANFKASSIRKTSKKIGLRTDASTKFEKNLDPNNARLAMERACYLVTLLGAGKVLEGSIDIDAETRTPNQVAYNAENINKLLGTQIPEATMVDYFKRLEFEVDEKNKHILAPTFRGDIEREADLAEEVARLYGYDRLPTTLDRGTPTVGKKSFEQKMEDLTRRTMEESGLCEAMIYSFEGPKSLVLLNLPEESELRKVAIIDNPLGEEFSMMRRSTMNGMLTVLASNYANRNEEVHLYEIGTIYEPETLPLTKLPKESQKLTLGMYGACDFFTIKGVLETLFEAMNCLDQVEFDPETHWSFLHPGRKAKILLAEKEVGYIGEVHPNVSEAYGIEEKVYVAVVDMKDLLAQATFNHRYSAVPKYPAVNRDLAMLIKEEMLVGSIEKIIKKKGGKLLETLTLFDVYQGAQIEAGYKSVAYALSFRATDHTLKEKEVSKIMKKILNSLEIELGATLRQ